MLKKVFNYGQGCKNIFKISSDNLLLNLKTEWEDNTTIYYNDNDVLNFNENDNIQNIDILKVQNEIKAFLPEYSDLKIYGNSNLISINQLDTETIWSQIKGNLDIDLNSIDKSSINLLKIKGENIFINLNNFNFNVKKNLTSINSKLNLTNCYTNINKLGITSKGELLLDNSILDVSNIYGFDNSKLDIIINNSEIKIKNISITSDINITNSKLDLNLNNSFSDSHININNSEGNLAICNKVRDKIQINSDKLSNINIRYYDNYFNF